MADLTLSQFEQHQANLKRMYGGGATDAQVGTYLSSYGLKPNDLLTAPQQPQAGTSLPIQPTRQDAVNRLQQAGAGVSFGLADQPFKGRYIDPTAARIAGGMVGGVVGAPVAAVTGPFAPASELGIMALGGAVGAEAAKLFNQYSGAVPPDKRPLPQRLAQTAVETANDAAGGAAFGSAGKLLRETVRAPARLLRATDAKGALQDFQDLGIPIAGQAGAITGNKGTQGMEAVLRKLPTSAALYQEADEAANVTFRNAGQDISGLAGKPGEPVVVGRRIIAGLNTFADQVRAKGRALFDPLKQLIGDHTSVQATETQTFVDDVVKPFLDTGANGQPVFSPAAQTGVPPIVKQLYQELVPTQGAITYQRLDAIRRTVGERLADPTLIEPNSIGQLKQVYKVVTADMEKTVAQMGPAAIKRWTLAKRYWGAAMGRVDLVREITANPKTEDAFNAAFAGEKNGPTLVRALKKTIPADTWGDLVASKITGMIEATPGQQNMMGTVSSPASFLTRWNTLPNSVKDTLFGTGSQLRPQMDRLARVAESIKDTAKERNFSNTGAANFFVNLLTNVPASLGTAIVGGAVGGGAGYVTGGTPYTIGAGVAAGLATPYLTARALMNPDVVRWLANGAVIAQKGTPAGIMLHLSRLAAIEANNPGIAPDLKNLRMGLAESMKQNPSGQAPKIGEHSQQTENAFQKWYAGHARRLGLNPNPDDPEHHYDYRAAYRAGVGPGPDGHWPSRFKDETHPNRFVQTTGGLLDTKYGKLIQP